MYISICSRNNTSNKFNFNIQMINLGSIILEHFYIIFKVIFLYKVIQIKDIK